MNERSTRIAIQIFAVGSALLVPISASMQIGPLTPTMYAGITLLMVYFAANPKLLNASRSEWKKAIQQGPVVPIALALGVMLMIIGIIEAGIGTT